MPVQRKIIEELKAAGLRDKVKVIIGGAPTTEKWAKDIGADGWAGDAVTAVSLAVRLLAKKPA
jgi:methanogenic corrinoid protein MtbC1